MIPLSKETISLLEDIEKRIDPAIEDDFRNQWLDFLHGRFEGDLFRAKRKKRSLPSVSLSAVNINDAIADYEMMLRAQLIGVSEALGTETGSLCMRANYGTGILSSMFGTEIFKMPREMNTLPTTRPVNDTAWIRTAIEKGIPDLKTGFGKQVLEFGTLCAEVFSKYPKISRYVTVYHPDLQGPLDICELLWGGEMFYAMYDEPELVHAMISLITETYTEMMHRWYAIFPPQKDMNPHWGSLWYRGNILLRNDSAMNISGEMYREFSLPYDRLLLQRFGGGAMHFCGRGDHYIEPLCSIPELTGINMSEPHRNDMEIIYRNTVDRGIAILTFDRERAQRDLSRVGGFHHWMSV